MSDYFDVQCVDEEGGIRFVLEGELDRAAARIFEHVSESTAARQPAALLVDANGLTFCDAAGVRAVLRAQDICDRNGIGFRVTGLRSSVRRVFDLTGANRAIMIEP